MELKLGLIFPAELQDEPVLCNLCKNFDIVVIIIEASFSTEAGWAMLILRGKEPEVQKAISYLEEHGIKLNKIDKILEP